VLAKVLLPAQEETGVSFVVYADLNKETIKNIEGHLSSNMEEIGYAMSKPYSAHALFNGLE
jgi:hypothetical protein